MYKRLTSWPARGQRCWCQDRTPNTIFSKKRHQELPMGQRAQGSLQITHQLDVLIGRRGELTHAEERRDAGALHFQDVVIRTDRKVLTSESE